MTPRRNRVDAAVSPRVALAERVVLAARESSTAGVLFHAALAASLGLTPTDHKTIEVLDRLGPQTAGEIAAHTGLTAASITSLLDRLEAKGFVRRERDTVDRRRVNVVLNGARAAQLRGEFPSAAAAALERLLERYSDVQLEGIADFLTTGAAWARDQAARLTKKKTTAASDHPKRLKTTVT